MIVDCIGCLHGYYPDLQGGDLLIVSGDLTRRDWDAEHLEAAEWMIEQNYKKVIFIAGNHDNFLQNEIETVLNYNNNEKLKYLCDSGTEFELLDIHKDGITIVRNRLKIWGLPHSLTFPRINPHCTAFTGDEAYMKKYCDLIPDDIDILISHSPPFGTLDGIEIMDGTLYYTGSHELLKAIDRVKPKYVICSHIHENGGKQMTLKYPGDGHEKNVQVINCSIMNERYRPVNKPVRIIL